MNAQAITRNTLAGITTSLAMVPEVVAFAVLLGILLTSMLYYWKHVKNT